MNSHSNHAGMRWRRSMTMGQGLRLCASMLGVAFVTRLLLGHVLWELQILVAGIVGVIASILWEVVLLIREDERSMGRSEKERASSAEAQRKGGLVKAAPHRAVDDP